MDKVVISLGNEFLSKNIWRPVSLWDALTGFEELLLKKWVHSFYHCLLNLFLRQVISPQLLLLIVLQLKHFCLLANVTPCFKATISCHSNGNLTTAWKISNLSLRFHIWNLASRNSACIPKYLWLVLRERNGLCKQMLEIVTVLLQLHSMCVPRSVGLPRSKRIRCCQHIRKERGHLASSRLTWPM